VFDLPVEYPDDTSPWIVRTMSLPEAIEKLKLIPPDGEPESFAGLQTAGEDEGKG